jgi:transposase
VVLFVDAAHFVHAAFLGFLWSFSRIFVKTPSGRKRFNVLGAVDAVTRKLTVIYNESYVNANTVCELLEKVARVYAGLPITLVMDNARYQKCKLVMELAEKLGIELLFLPPYSPNLNLIERYWKFIKKKCLRSKYYEKFDQFKEAILAGIECSNNDWHEELLTLLSHNFQSFKITKY